VSTGRGHYNETSRELFPQQRQANMVLVETSTVEELNQCMLWPFVY
jgi:hypothetical protein